jgi:putative ABC transport system permease protein
VRVTGVSSSSLTDAFRDDSAKLTAGRQITSQDASKKVALIEKNLAEQNGLKVGDKIKIKATGSTTTVEYSIVGIYQAPDDSSAQGAGMRNFSFSQPYNQIYVDYQSALPLKTGSESMGSSSDGIDSAVFFVDDPQNISQVEADAKKMDIDWSKFVLDANDTAYQQMMGPIESIGSFAQTIVYVVAVAGALILALILTLSIKERTYETGVLLSMGEGKLKVVGQYFAEALIVAVLAFTLSALGGKFIAQGVSDMLLGREVQVTQTQTADNFRTGGRGFAMREQGTDYQAIDTLDVQITGAELEQLAGIGLLILIGGTLIPATSIMRYKPNTILSKLA